MNSILKDLSNYCILVILLFLMFYIFVVLCPYFSFKQAFVDFFSRGLQAEYKSKGIIIQVKHITLHTVYELCCFQKVVCFSQKVTQFHN